MTEQEANELLIRYNQGQVTEAEYNLIAHWYRNESVRLQQKEPLAVDYLAIKERVWNRLQPVQLVPQKKSWPMIRIVAIAATVLLTLGIGIYSWKLDREEVIKHSISPGTNKAFITTEAGETVNLSSSQTRVKIEGAALAYGDGTAISQIATENPNRPEILTASTPMGGTYEVVLSDGTIVTLNAGTSLKFPSTFSKEGKRIVELLAGEAFFNVTKDPKHPFVVLGKGQNIEVLGTQFNVNTYSTEIRTALVEGSVRINQQEVLRPGQEAVLKGTQIDINTVDTDQIVAWKEGYFHFDENNFENTMSMIARWYDVDIVYDYRPKGLRLAGQVSRDKSIETVLNILQKTGEVRFAIEGRRIRVIK